MANNVPKNRKTKSAWWAVSLNVGAIFIFFFQPVSGIIRQLSAGIVPRVFKLWTHSFPSVRKSHRRGEWKRRGATGPMELCKSDAVSSSGTQDCAKPDAEPLQWKMYTPQRLMQRLMQRHFTPLSFLLQLDFAAEASDGDQNLIFKPFKSTDALLYILIYFYNIYII